MTEQKITNIINFLAKEQQKHVKLFDVFNENVTEETTQLCFLNQDNNLILIDTKRNQKDLTTVDLKQAINQF